MLKTMTLLYPSIKNPGSLLSKDTKTINSPLCVTHPPQLQTMHQVINPAILYWGSAVIIISTTNPDGTTNLAPMSSAWWLGQHCMLGLAAESQTTINLQRTKQCVLNMPSASMVAQVNGLAKTTGRETLSPFKKAAGYRYVKDKFAVGALTPMPSEVVEPARVEECPVQMEAELRAVNEMNRDEEGMSGFFLGRCYSKN